MQIDSQALLQGMSALGQGLMTVIAPMSFLTGVFFIFAAGKRLARPAPRDENTSPWGPVSVKLLVGGALLNFAGFTWNLRGAVGGAGAEVRAAMMSNVTGTSPVYTLAIATAMLWVGFIGTCAVFRGILLLHRAGSGDSQSGGDDFWSAFWHLIGGAICVNFGFGW